MRSRLGRIFVAIVVCAGFTTTLTQPAAADPTTTFVTVGSDVTQDVTNQFATDEFPGLVGSYDAAPTGALQYIPFALDSVAPATGPATTITHADDFTLGTATTPGTLIRLYRDCAAVTVDGVTYDPNIPAAAGNQQIHLYVPQAGSGTRTFWAATLSFSATTLPSCVHDTSTVTGAAVQQDDGTVYAGDPAGIGPFSVAQYVAQTNGHDDRRHGATIHSLNPSTSGGQPIAPTIGGSLNTAYPITREVYTVVLRSRVVNTGTGFSQALANLFVGPGSQLCSDELTIIGFGFAALDNAPLGHTCGATTNDLRAFDPTTNPI